MQTLRCKAFGGAVQKLRRYTAWIMAGGHIALSFHRFHQGTLIALADMLGIETVVIDKNTDIYSLKRTSTK
jgi:L-arabinose isomerase